MNKEDVLKILSQLDKKRFFVLEIGLFGSYARNETIESRDINIMVEFEFKKRNVSKLLCITWRARKIIRQESWLNWKSIFDYKFKNSNVKSYKKVKEEILGKCGICLRLEEI